MKNLIFEFNDYDKVINLNTFSILSLKKKMSNIEATLIIFSKEEKKYKFNIDNSCILNSINAVYNNNKLILLWENTESNIVLSVNRLDNEILSNKNHLIVSYDCNKVCKSPKLLSYNNNLIIFWLESNYYSNLEYSKFNIHKQVYDIDETSTDIYINLIKSEIIINNLEISCKHMILSSSLKKKNNFFLLWGYRNRLNKYKLLFIEIDTNHSFYINTDEDILKSLSMFYSNHNFYILWINNKNNILGRSIHIISDDNYQLNKEMITSFKDPFNLLYNKISYGGLEDNKLIKIPIKIDNTNIIEGIIHTSGKNSFIILADIDKTAKMIIKFDVNNVIYLNNTLIADDTDLMTVSCETSTSLNYIVFFKYAIINDYLLCYQNNNNNTYHTKDYNINKIDEIMDEINKGINEINDNMINYNEKNVSIYKIFKSIM
jgi:hypothetical protein